MIKRVAFFSDKTDIENYFDLSTGKENIFSPHYNLSPGQHIPVVYCPEEKRLIERCRWGSTSPSNGKTENTSIPLDAVPEEIENNSARRCVVPLSGFYIWKEKLEKEHPFFVRMLNNPLMPVAGLRYNEKDDQDHFRIILSPSNALIQPMSAHMPLLLNQEVSRQWLNPEYKANELLKKAVSLFLLTDLSVMRVSKKVNNPENNDAKLIQPIPK